MSEQRPRHEDYLYNWNQPDPKPAHRILFNDVTLRDGIQSPSIVDPPIEHKKRLLAMTDALGIYSSEISLPGAGAHACRDTEELTRYIRDAKLRIKPVCVARTRTEDIVPIVEISQKVGVAIECLLFLGSSTLRRFAEGWDMARMVKFVADSVGFAVKAGLECTFVTEDTTRSSPEIIETLFGCAIEHGAKRLGIADTVGEATPLGARNIVGHVRQWLERHGVRDRVGLDWHGHNDRGLGVATALEAARSGAERIHGSALGVGERVGNSALDQIMVNMKLLGWLPDHDLSRIVEWCEAVAEVTEWTIPPNYPVAGVDAFRTATGVHAAAIIKLLNMGDEYLATRMYSSVPADMFGRSQVIEIGPMSGGSNVAYWLESHKIASSPELIEHVLAFAKTRNRVLTDAEARECVASFARS